MATHKRKQANSLFMDIPYDSWATINSTWANWSGKWTIRATLDSPVLLSGLMSLSDTEGVFDLRIGPDTTTGWATLPVGTYVLSLELNCQPADFRYEVQDKLIIEAQGVPNA